MPNGYTVAVTREGDTVVLTNTAKKSGNPDGEVNPPSKKPTDKTVNKTTDKTSGQASTDRTALVAGTCAFVCRCDLSAGGKSFTG